MIFQGFRFQATAILLKATTIVNTTPFRAHFSHADIFSRVAPAELTLRSSHRFVVFHKCSHLHSHSLSHAQCSWLGRTPHPLPHSTSSFVDPLHGGIHCDPHHGGQFGRTTPHDTFWVVPLPPLSPLLVGAVLASSLCVVLLSCPLWVVLISLLLIWAGAALSVLP